MILSFHPLYEADKNLLCAGRDPGLEEMEAIAHADAVILPQGCRESLYAMARKSCPNVFPNYDKRFAYSGKVGQARLFREIGVAHPRTKVYEKGVVSKNRLAALLKNPPLAPPFIFKFDWGGEGENVHVIQSMTDFERILDNAVQYEKSGQRGFLLQEFIPAKGRSLRVVVIYEIQVCYWRTQENPNLFYTNLKKGATIDFDSDPDFQSAAISAVQDFCRNTHINLAGFDLLFSEKDLASGIIKPLFLEINYYFGRQGIGGSEVFYKILKQQINNWIRDGFRTPLGSRRGF